ncbi:phosphate acyltransferase PlsX [Pelagibacterium sp. 26DY04]|uniref:phosphate acyltransferase PlsX n=1 Tax=unclassified Pelagibacterium TaxID=2623280 RepID=UPI0028153B83|nr:MULTISPECIES: phosphate acyltransferase PlsX [unclassified Pelagibacterium]WMT88551.1 phosphate acyltransferase PlsX [Pelagibacterium sp. 26DY04]WMT90770.1 phosphate acyltransferase PlsX [Pelagibacterium sp. H642]
MSETITISVDAMGGDNAPRAPLHGAKLLLRERPNARFIFHGREEAIRPLMAEFPELGAVSEVRHSETVITMDDKPSQALRKGRGNSSMWAAIQSVKDGEAAVAISGGNTGALMAMATFCLRTMDGISRPAISAIWPTLRSDIIVLDVGATIGADARQLVDFSILGAALARAVFDIESPTVGLLNVGVEEAKGNESVKDAGKILSESSGAGFTYKGFVEGDDLGKGTVDVVVTEGFTGNIALKTAEGTARQVGTYLRDAMTSSLMSKIGALFARQALGAIRSKMDPRTVNGGVFLGLNGVVIKSHGGTDEIGYKSALNLAYDMARNDLIAKIGEGLKNFPTLAVPADLSNLEAPSA